MSFINKETNDFHVFDVLPGYSSHRNTPEPLEISLFDNRPKLREHAIKHFANTFEAEVWQKLIDFEWLEIVNRLESIKALGGFCSSLGTEGTYCRKCPKYSNCTLPVEMLENTYVACIIKVIGSGLRIPRNASFQNNSKNSEDFWVLSDPPVVVKMYWDDSRYSIATCFIPNAGIRSTRNELIEKMRRSIVANACGKITWCIKENWVTPLCPELPNHYQQNFQKEEFDTFKKPKKKQAAKGKKERGGSSNLRTSYSRDEEDY